MSRSYKKYPYIGGSDSDKFSKRIVNKGVRKFAKLLLANFLADDISQSLFATKNDIKDIYYFAKDDGYDVDINDTWHYFINGKLRK